MDLLFVVSIQIVTVNPGRLFLHFRILHNVYMRYMFFMIINMTMTVLDVISYGLLDT